MGPLGAPVLSLEIDAVSKVDGEDALGTLLSLFSKCRESLQDGPRLENMVWRLWHLERLVCCCGCRVPSDCSCPGTVASTIPCTPSLSSDDSALASSDEDQGDQNKDSHVSSTPSTPSQIASPLSGSNGSRRTKRPSRSSAHSHSEKERAPSSSSLPPPELPTSSRRPSLLTHRTHSNTSVGKIMVDLLPEKLVVPNGKNYLPSPIEGERRQITSMPSLTPSGNDVPAVVVMSDGTKGASDGVHSGHMSPARTLLNSSSGPTRTPTVVIVNPTPHPTPPMTPHVQSPQRSSQDASAHANRLVRDNLVVPSRGTLPAQLSSSSSSSSTTLAEASSSTSLRPKPGNDTVVNGPLGTGLIGNGIGPSDVNVAQSLLAASSESGGKVGTTHQPTEHHLPNHPRHSPLQNKLMSNLFGRGQLQPSTSTSMAQQASHRDRKFFIERSVDGDSPDTSESSHVGSHSQTMSVSNCSGNPGTSVASAISGVSAGTSALSGVSGSSHCTTSQSPSVSHRAARSVSGQSDKSSQQGEMYIQTPHHTKAKSSKGSTSMGSASGSEVLRIKTKSRKGKEARFTFGRPGMTRTQSGFRQGNQLQHQTLYQAPAQQQKQPQPQQLERIQQVQPQVQNHVNGAVGNLAKVASGYQLNMGLEKVNGAQRVVSDAGVGAGAGVVTGVEIGPTAAVAGPSKVQVGGVKTPVSPQRQQAQVQAQASTSRHQQPAATANGVVASSSKARMEIHDDSDEDSEDWEDESSALSEDVTEDGDAKSTRSTTKGREDLKKAGLLNEAAKEAQRQTDMFAKVDRRSYTNLNRTQSGLLSTIFHPDPSRFPQGHPYRQTRSTHDILALSNRRWLPPYSPSPLPQGQGKGALAGPVAAQVTTEVAQSPANSRSKLRLKGCPEGEMESSGEEDVENTVPISTSLAEQKLAELHSKSRRQQSQQPQPPARHQPQSPSQPQAQNPQTSQAVPMGFALGYPYELLPPPVPPSTPRTTRRNMLKKELSESLRRNLLWERQVSKHGPIGLGNGAAAARRVTAPVNGKPAVAEQDERTSRALSRKHTWEDEFHGVGW